MPDEQKLPPLPGSDEKSISSNIFDPFYKTRARDFWSDNKIIRETPEEFKKCKHSFISKPGGAECKACHMGLLGFFEVQKGKLYHKGKALEL